MEELGLDFVPSLTPARGAPVTAGEADEHEPAAVVTDVKEEHPFVIDAVEQFAVIKDIHSSAAIVGLFYPKDQRERTMTSKRVASQPGMGIMDARTILRASVSSRC